MILAMAALAQSILPTPPDGRTWRMVWNDEFNAPAVDPSKWTILVGPRAGGYVTPRNVAVKNGFLHLAVGALGDKMSTGSLDSRGKTAFRYGYFEIRCKLPLRPGGHRPAFWLTSPSVNQVGDAGRDGTEIDIFEAPGRSGHVDINLHWDGYGFDKKSFHYAVPKPIDYLKFHTYGLWWSPDRYRFYIDGDLVLTTREGGVSQAPESVLVTDEVLETDRLAAANMAMIRNGFVDDFVVDYVRVYQLTGPS
jgi:beta-glucanase (GH16 family)